MSRFNYFAYGSNMLHRRLAARTPSAVFQSIASLSTHKLVFNKVSFKDGTGKCGIVETGNKHDRVLGVLYTIAEAERNALDAAEGLGKGYDHKHIHLQRGVAESIQALTYYPTNIKDGLQPFDWYKAFVVAGAKENNLDADYIAAIENITAITDADEKRAAENWQLLNHI